MRDKKFNLPPKKTPVRLEVGIISERSLQQFELIRNACIELGLTSVQKNTINFGWHTIKAIKTIKKRNKDISVNQAFDMIKGMSEQQAKTFLASSKTAFTPLMEITTIRVIVKRGRGFGHQRAAITLMQKLREIGFVGVFDIQCGDMLGQNMTKDGRKYKNQEAMVSPNLIQMIPGFVESVPDADGIRSVPSLGQIRMSSLPHDFTSNPAFKLPSADLAVCAADDHFRILMDAYADNTLTLFNAKSFMLLQPTDWHMGSSLVIDSDGVYTLLPSAREARLSSHAADKPIDIASIKKTAIEKNILTIASSPKINSQLVYGLYPATTFDIDSFTPKLTGKLDPIIQMNRIIEANKEISKKTQKPSVLLLPQDLVLEPSFRRGVKSANVHFIDLTTTTTNLDRFGPGDVIIAHTGPLQQAVFDYLMLQGTTLPAVIEGCNSREACEFAGKPFIHGSVKMPGLRQYEVVLQSQQELHRAASACLETGDPKFLSQLVQYMEATLNPGSDIHHYHKQRQAAFMARPDACENALETLGIKYRKPSQKSGARLTF